MGVGFVILAFSLTSAKARLKEAVPVSPSVRPSVHCSLYSRSVTHASEDPCPLGANVGLFFGLFLFKLPPPLACSLMNHLLLSGHVLSFKFNCF